MNNFELFKLKMAGLSNLQLNRLLAAYQDSTKKISLKAICHILDLKKPSLFMENYHSLDSKECRKLFQRFPSFSILDDTYPLELKQIYNPPVLLFYQGDLSLLNRTKIGFVGSRKASPEGVKSTEKIIKELQNQFVVVSGLARGIDTAAHMACLKNGGKTIAVIGSGLDQYYPKENKALQDYLSKHHLVLSEYPAGTQPLKFHFPERNRIIAGLSMGVVVAEARLRSGSLITCERALEEGREVFAIPGSILEQNWLGCLQLIKEGANCITSGIDVINELKK
ncbi:TPA: DNA-processing protein DprA [Streptococcus suis]